MLNSEQIALVHDEANKRSIEPTKLLAFMEVETNGQVFATVGGKQRPLIRWEGHYFYKLVPPKKLPAAIAAGLANKKVGGVKNPKDQVSRYQMLAKGKQIDETAAISSCSWGIGQVMGSHWETLGFKSARDFETRAKEGFEGQLDIMMRYADAFGVIPHLRRGDWSAVARIWNGSGYRKNKYDEKMKDAYERLTGDFRRKPSSAGMLRQGSKGPRVREVQRLLIRAGYSIDADGDFGSATEKAVRAFQSKKGIEVDGIVGPGTLRLLNSFKANPDEQLGTVSTMQDPKIRNSLVTTGVGLGVIETAKSQVDDALSQVSGLAGSAVIDYVIGGLTVCSAVLAVGGLAYAGWRWFHKDDDYVGVEVAT